MCVYSILTCKPNKFNFNPAVISVTHVCRPIFKYKDNFNSIQFKMPLRLTLFNICLNTCILCFTNICSLIYHLPSLLPSKFIDLNIGV